MNPPRLRRLAVFLLVASTACFTVDDRITVQPDGSRRPVVDRLGPDRVRLRWPEPMAQGPVTVFAGLSTGTIDYSRPLATGTNPLILTTEVLAEGVNSVEDSPTRHGEMVAIDAWAAAYGSRGEGKLDNYFRQITTEAVA